MTRDFAQRAEDVLQQVLEANTRYQVTQSLQTASTFAFERIKPQVAKTADRIKESLESELDKRGYLPQTHEFLQQADGITGLSRSLHAIQRELQPSSSSSPHEE